MRAYNTLNPCRRQQLPSHQWRRRCTARAAPSSAQTQLLLSSADVPAYLEQYEALQRRLGGPSDEWEVEELQGGVINACWSVRRRRQRSQNSASTSSSDAGGGDDTGVIVKQALPYVKAVGPDFPLSTVRVTSATRAPAPPATAR